MTTAQPACGLRNEEVDAAAHAAVVEEVRGLEASILREIIKFSRLPGVVSLSGGMPAEDLFDVEGLQAAAMDKVFGSPATARDALQYDATEGNEDLRSHLVALMEGRGVRGIDKGLVLITTGASQGIDLVARALLGEGDTIAVEKPTFLATLNAAQLREANIVEVPIDEDGLQVDELEAILDNGSVKLIYTMPTFSNPSGAVLSLERRHRLLELAREHDIVVVEDDAYGSLWFDEPPPPSLLSLAQQLDHPPVCVHMSTFSKIVAPGVRLGWLIAPPSLLERVAVVKQIADVHTSSLDQAIVLAYLESGRLPAHIERVRRSYAQRARWLTEALREGMPEGSLKFDSPRGGMFLWCRLMKGTAADFAQRARDEKVTVVPGDPFFSEAPREQYLRLSFSQLSRDRATEAVSKLAAAV